MGDINDFYKDLKDSSKKRADNRAFSTRLLDSHGVKFVSRNKGVHLIVEGPHGLIDFWPGTGKWRDRANSGGRGVKNLLKYMGVPR